METFRKLKSSWSKIIMGHTKYYLHFVSPFLNQSKTLESVLSISIVQEWVYSRLKALICIAYTYEIMTRGKIKKQQKGELPQSPTWLYLLL